MKNTSTTIELVRDDTGIMASSPAIEQDEKGIIIPADQLADTLEIHLARPSPTLQILFWLLLSLLIAAVLWAYFSTVTIAIHAPGMIRPSIALQTFRSPFNGTLDSLYIHENMFVHNGDTLAVFQNNELRTRQRISRTDEQVIQSEVTDLQTLLQAIPENLTIEYIMENLPASLPLHLPHYAAEYNLIKKDIQILVNQYKVFKSKSDRTQKLLEKNYASPEEYESAAGDVRLQELKLVQYLQDKQKVFRSRLYELQQSVSTLHKEEANIRDNITHSYIIANVAGNITSMKIDKEGVFCSAGQELFSITPNQELLAEVRVNPRDAALIRDSLSLTYQIEGFDYNEWEMATGVVKSIPKDISFDETSGRPYYKVLCSFNNTRLRYKRGNKQAFVDLRKGLPLQANIKVGEKRLLALLYDRTVDYFYFR